MLMKIERYRHLQMRYVLALMMLMFAWPIFAETIVIPKGEGPNCQRIVSVSPALSDMMVELKLDDRIVGATRYGRLPKTDQREIVGGYFDLNFEKVVSLNPDIVFLESSSDSPIVQRLNSLGIKNRAYSLDTIDEIEAAKQEIANYCEGEVIVGLGTLHDRIASLVPKAEKGTQHIPPRVLILYNYGDNAEKVLPKLAAGRSFHGELLEVLQMENVYIGALNAPELSREAISLLNPEWIFILNGDLGRNQLAREEVSVTPLRPKWEFLQGIEAIKNNQVYELRGFYTQVPSVAAMRTLASIFAEKVYSK